ncbi:methyl-accepting chemotaxis protein [Paenibacillus thalictri]|uniref:Methyl-accepting chemotaxis protein n=1 Tax=Paenibacillus thalictri TaxID=2527873 RepID=A0A4Q9DI44_9BACL|nr:methyl-accepting chemotaxis protein [Paenibacillus thalictri]TBL72683.1 methyl-accepting chemotaxis protein [Paenibacillus thalictri]
MRGWFHSLSSRFMVYTGVVLFLLMCGLYWFEWQQIRKDAEQQLLEKGSGLAIALAKSLQQVTESDIITGVTLKNGTKLSGDTIKTNLFNDKLQLVPESEQAAKKRSDNASYASSKQVLFNGKEIPLAQYELKYTSAYDAYTDDRWQGIMDSFLVDDSVIFSIAAAYSDNPDTAGYIPTHNSKYSPTGDGSKDEWGAADLLSQKYRANRVFNDAVGYNSAAYADTAKAKLEKYPRVIDGKVLETWNIAYPLMIEGKHWGGVRVALSKEQSDAMIERQRMTILAGMGLLFVAVLVILYILSRTIVGARLAFILKAATNLNSHEADLTYRMPVKGRDEIAQLSREINAFLGHLQEIVVLIRGVSAQTRSTSESLTASAARSAEVSVGIAEAIGEVAAGADNQATGATDSAKATEEMAVGIGKIAEASGAVTEASHHMVHDAEQGNDMTRSAVAQMETMYSSAIKVSEAIERLRKRSDEIGEIATAITGIASQTSLLALNAAIEAARAGEQGRGFSIVAGEVRKLADQSDESARHISELIDELQKLTAAASAAMEEGGGEVAKSMGAVGHVSEAFERIVGAAREVSAAITDISGASQELSAGTEEVTAGIEQMSRIAHDASVHAGAVAEASQTQLALSKETSGLSGSLSKLAQELDQTLGKFKV